VHIPGILLDLALNQHQAPGEATTTIKLIIIQVKA
jgi:hypothetical protein